MLSPSFTYSVNPRRCATHGIPNFPRSVILQGVAPLLVIRVAAWLACGGAQGVSVGVYTVPRAYGLDYREGGPPLSQCPLCVCVSHVGLI